MLSKIYADYTASITELKRNPQMTRKHSTKADPIEHEIERMLNPGAFISDRACFVFVSDLDEVAAKIANLAGSEPTRAVALYDWKPKKWIGSPT